MQWPAHICTALVLRKKLRAAQTRLALVKESFAELDNGVPPELWQKWVQQEMTALTNQILDPKAMDIVEVQLQKGEDQTRGIDLMLICTAPTSKSVEIDLTSRQGEYGCPHGSVTWLAKALKLEEAQLVFALDSQQAESTMRSEERRVGKEC